MSQLLSILRPGYRHLRNQRGASTVEYVVVLTAAVALAAILYNVLASDEIKGTLQAKIESILTGNPGATEPAGGDSPSGDTGGDSESDPAQPVSHPTDQPDNPSSPPPQKEEPSTWDQIGNYLDRKWNYTKKKAGEYWDGFWGGIKEEGRYAISDPVGWWFWDDMKSSINGVDERTGEKLGWWERGDRFISGIPVGIGKGWKWGKAGGKTAWKGIKEVDDFFIGLACAKEKKGKGCTEKRSAPKHNVVNTLKDFKSCKYNMGGHDLLLDKRAMKHILERHHPDYYNTELAKGKQKTTFFDESMTVDDIISIVDRGIKDNREKIINNIIPNGGRGQITINVDGKEYILGFNRYRVGQLYPE
ncbi:DUF4244 domain-containing protein [Paludifilum halophilum]|uniref:DUF4244 domain-containing protein n=1 Tax=Paludifilum halophilum TaxID=1642702 RepID=UPI00198209D7|nr:DUF4244 domain-containing protein [Paludifilum halophilum]